jgi:hypothetical protein
MDEYERETILEALCDYRTWYSENDKEDLPQIERIDAAKTGIKQIFIPQNREENLWYAINALEELLDFGWDTKNLRFINSSILTLKSIMLNCRS